MVLDRAADVICVESAETVSVNPFNSTFKSSKDDCEGVGTLDSGGKASICGWLL